MDPHEAPSLHILTITAKLTPLTVEPFALTFYSYVLGLPVDLQIGCFCFKYLCGLTICYNIWSTCFAGKKSLSFGYFIMLEKNASYLHFNVFFLSCSQKEFLWKPFFITNFSVLICIFITQNKQEKFKCEKNKKIYIRYCVSLFKERNYAN